MHKIEFLNGRPRLILANDSRLGDMAGKPFTPIGLNRFDSYQLKAQNAIGWDFEGQAHGSEEGVRIAARDRLLSDDGFNAVAYDSTPPPKTFHVPQVWNPGYGIPKGMIRKENTFWMTDMENRVRRLAAKYADDPYVLWIGIGDELLWQQMREYAPDTRTLLDTHRIIYDVISELIRKYFGADMLIGSNKYAAGGPGRSLLNGKDMSENDTDILLKHAIDAGIDILQVNYYPASEAYTEKYAETLRYWFNRTAGLGYGMPVIWAETGCWVDQAWWHMLRHGRWMDLARGDYGNKGVQYPRVKTFRQKAQRFDTCLKTAHEGRSLGLFWHAAFDHGNQFEAPWGLYNRITEKVYQGMLDRMREGIQEVTPW